MKAGIVGTSGASQRLSLSATLSHVVAIRLKSSYQFVPTFLGQYPKTSLSWEAVNGPYITGTKGRDKQAMLRLSSPSLIPTCTYETPAAVRPVPCIMLDGFSEDLGWEGILCNSATACLCECYFVYSRLIHLPFEITIIRGIIILVNLQIA